MWMLFPDTQVCRLQFPLWITLLNVRTPGADALAAGGGFFISKEIYLSTTDATEPHSSINGN